MKTIDVKGLASSPIERLRFLEEFVGFTAEDQQALADSVEHLGPKLPGLLDAIYEHLLSYDDTRRLFLGKRGEIDPEYMAIRKEHLTGWVLRTVEAGDRSSFAQWLASIGRAHTGVAGDPGRVVPPRYMVALASFVQTAIWATLFEALPHDPARVRRMGLAWNKTMMIQLEFFLKAMAPAWPAWDEA